jgi:hypothetical protein
MLGRTNASDNEFIAICLLENRKAIEAIQSEHKDADPQVFFPASFNRQLTLSVSAKASE